jgi:predicted solute-binding protein
VNDYSLDIGEEGLSAVKGLFRKAAMKGMLKESVDDLLCIM